MLTQQFAHRFAAEWIAAWNPHDLRRILAHYADDFEMSSPFIVKYAGEPSGTLQGKDAVGRYWQQTLKRIPDLHFTLIDALFSVESICLYYRSVFEMRAVEWLRFNDEGKVSKAVAHYHTSPPS